MTVWNLTGTNVYQYLSFFLKYFVYNFFSISAFSRQASIPVKEEWSLKELLLDENNNTTAVNNNNHNIDADILTKLNHYSSQPQSTNYTSSSSDNFTSSSSGWYH